MNKMVCVTLFISFLSLYPCKILSETKYGFTEDEKTIIINTTNKWRSEVEPQASNLHTIIWDNELSDEAQSITDKCSLNARTQEDKTIIYSIKSNAKGLANPITEFWESYNGTGTQIGDPIYAKYLPFISDTSFKMGCSVNRNCTLGNYKQLLLCVFWSHQRPHQPAYQQGPPCSKCIVEMGSFCYNFLCASRQQCDANKWNCTCNLTCRNCSTLNKETCSCSCLRGFDGSDCTQSCVDQLLDCHNATTIAETDLKPVKGKEACATNYLFRNRDCRKFCGKCLPANNFSFSQNCCPELKCKKNETKDKNTCQCLAPIILKQKMTNYSNQFDIDDYMISDYCPGTNYAHFLKSITCTSILLTLITVIC